MPAPGIEQARPMEWRRWKLATKDPALLMAEFDVLVGDDERVLRVVRYYGYFESQRERWFCPAVINTDGSIDFGSAYSGHARDGFIAIHGVKYGGNSIRFEHDEKIRWLDGVNEDVIIPRLNLKRLPE